MTDRPAEEPTRLLVVDDSAANRYVVASWLRRAGYLVTEAEDGAGALAAAGAMAADGRPPEVAVIDVGLPDMTGMEVCERIKADPDTAGVPVIHMSATSVALADRTQGLHRGADAFLVEPIEPEELLATVTAVLRHSRARNRAERLAARLTALNQATLDLHGATDFERFRAAALAGACAVLGSDTISVFLSLDGRATRTTRAAAGRSPATYPIPAERLDAVAARVLGSRSGADVAVLPLDEWKALLGSTSLAGDIAVAAVRPKSGRPAVCIALPAAALRTPDDFSLLLQLAQACALSLDSLREYTEEHALALALQRSFLPDRLPDVSGVTLAVRYVPASLHTEIGGDFYEALETRHGLLLAIGDVVGHSLEAALVMGQVRHALRAYAVEGHPPAQILRLLDTLLLTLLPEMTTVTVCLVLIEPGGRRIHVANAGHIPPLLHTPDGECRFLTEHGPLLGVGGRQPEPTVHEVEPPCRMVIVTDGLLEVRGDDLAEAFARFATAVRTGPASLDELCDMLLDAFGKEKDDDIALLAADLRPR